MSSNAAPPAAPGLWRLAWPYAAPEASRLAGSALVSALQIGCSLLRPWPLALTVDSALGGLPPTGPLAGWLTGLSPQALLVAAAWSMVLLTVADGLLGALATSMSERAAERIGGSLRSAVFTHVLTLSLRWHDRMRSGEIGNRLTTDVGRVLDAVVVHVATLVPDLLLLGGVLVVLVAVDPVLAGLGLAVLPLLIWLTARRRRLVRAAERTARDEAGRMSGTALDVLRNVRAVQAFGRHDRARELFGAVNDRVVRAEERSVSVEARWSPVPSAVLALGTGIVLVAGGMRVLSGALTTGELLIVIFYLRDLQSPVRGLVRLVAVRAKAAASVARLAEILDCTESVPVPAQPLPVPAVREGLRLERVTFGYDGDRPVLRDFDLDVAAGETVCLFGPSGAGKSTVLQLLLRLYDVDGGRVLLDGVDVRELDPVQLRRRLAFVPQDPWLLDGTIAENIAFGHPGAGREHIRAAGREAWVEEFAAHLPLGYDTPLGEGGVLLSGGQRRRVAIARAVVSPAPVVLLDEPTTSLDEAAADQVIAAIRSVGERRTVVLVTHDPRLAEIADRIVHVAPLRGRPSPDDVPEPETDRIPVPGRPTDTDRMPVAVGATDSAEGR